MSDFGGTIEELIALAESEPGMKKKIAEAEARQTCQTRAHREQLFSIIEHPGMGPGDTISHYLLRDLCKAGYVVRNSCGDIYSTPKGEAALREGLLQ